MENANLLLSGEEYAAWTCGLGESGPQAGRAVTRYRLAITSVHCAAPHVVPCLALMLNDLKGWQMAVGLLIELAMAGGRIHGE